MKLTDQQKRAAAVDNLNQSYIRKVMREESFPFLEGPTPHEGGVEEGLKLVIPSMHAGDVYDSLQILLGDSPVLQDARACGAWLLPFDEKRKHSYARANDILFIHDEEALRTLANAGVEFPGANVFREPAAELTVPWASRAQRGDRAKG